MSEERKQEGEERSILWARLAVRHTKKTCCLVLLVPISAIVILYAARLFELTEPSNNEYNVKSDPITKKADAITRAREEYPFEVEDTVVALTKRNLLREISILMRSTGGGNSGDYSPSKYSSDEPFANLLTREGLSFLKSVEDKITQSKDYSRFCWNDLTDNIDCTGKVRTCAPPFSITSHPDLYGNILNGRLCRKAGSDLVSVENYNSFLESLVVGGKLNPQYSVFFDNEFNISSKAAQAIRSFVYSGAPIANTTEATIDEEKLDAYRDWVKDLEKDIEKSNTEDFHAFLSSVDSLNANFGPIIFRDLAYAGVSILLVFLIVWAHTTSGFLACTTLAQIILSFPLTYLFYRGVLQITYFAALQIMMIFLILGIGADDVFVFTDAFKQAAHELGDDITLERRLDWSYRRAVKAMLVTSITTAVAFFSTAVSPIMPIATLGVWAGFLVLFQFILVITVFPSALVLWYRFWRIRKWWRCFKSTPERVPESSERPNNVLTRLRARFAARPEGELRAIEKFFNGPWTKITFKLRWVLLALGVIITAVSIWLSTLLETPTEEEQFLPPDHPIREAQDILSDKFPSFGQNENIIVSSIWGIKTIDRKGTDRYNPTDLGEPVFSEKFNLRSIPAQKTILDSCDFYANPEFRFLVNSTTIPNEEIVKCWPRDYLKWRESQGLNGFRSFSSDEEQIQELIRFSDWVSPSGKKPYKNYLTDQFIGFNKNRTSILWTETRFLSEVEFGEPYAIVWPSQEDWHEALEEFNSTIPVSEVTNPYITGGMMWSWAVTQRALVQNMYVGIGVVLAVSLIMLTVSTGNIIVAVLALACIVGILTNVLALIYIFGWKLGITESIGIVIAIGFSFDYVAHVANAYVESNRNLDKLERTRLALTELGISVLAGAFSTLIAGAMLFFATIIFFVKFGVFVVMTVSLALVWGLIFLPALLHLFGPSGNLGDVWVCLRKIPARFGKKKKAEGSVDPASEIAPSSKPEAEEHL